MRNDPRIKKLRQLALKGATPGERDAAVRAIGRVEQSARAVPLFSEDEPVDN